MTYLATLYIIAINFINSISRSNRILLYSTIFFMVLLFGGIYNCADDSAYHVFYDSIKSNGLTQYTSTEFGFKFLAFIAGKIGLSYKLFKTTIAITGLLLIQKTTLQYTEKYSIVFLLYFIYPFMIDVIQFRNFLSASIIIYSIPFLVNNSRNGNIKYVFGILIAFSIHYMAVFFLPFIIMKRYSIRRLTRVAILFVPVFCILTSTQIMPNIISSLVGEERMYGLSFYFQRANWGFLLLWTRQLSFFLLTYLCYLFIQKSDIEENWKSFNNLIIKLNIYLIIVCFPLVMFNGNFFRLLRPILFLNYIIISQIFYLNPKKGLVFFALAFILSFIYFGLDILTESNVISVLTPFFHSNSYLSF